MLAQRRDRVLPRRSFACGGIQHDEAADTGARQRGEFGHRNRLGLQHGLEAGRGGVRGKAGDVVVVGAPRRRDIARKVEAEAGNAGEMLVAL